MQYTTKNKLVLIGGSMRPLYNSGEVVQLINEMPKIGDVAVYKINDRVFAHRVIFKTKNFIVVGSDSASTPYHKVYKKNIIGKIEKRGGLLQHFLFNIIYKFRILKNLIKYNVL